MKSYKTALVVINSLVNNTVGKHALSVGLTKEINVEINGHVGYYCAGMNQEALIKINGNAGPGLAENMMSGEVRVTGNASQYAAATAHGGCLLLRVMRVRDAAYQ